MSRSGESSARFLLKRGAEVYVYDDVAGDKISAVMTELALIGAHPVDSDGLERAGEHFLSRCRGLTALTLPEGLESAGDYFLYECTGLKELTVPVATPPAVGSNGAFNGVSNTIPVYVPAGSIEAYKTAAVWSYFTDYRPLGNTGIGTPSLAGSVTVAGGEVRLHLAGNPTIYIYDMQGRHLLTTTEHRITLPQGSYIIKVGREAVKVAL